MNPQLTNELRAILGDRGLITAKNARFAYESDGLTLKRHTPELVLLPRNTEEAAACMRLLHAEGIPVVPRGAGTGLSGGATPVEGGVVIGTARMRDILQVNPKDHYARVQAGVVNVDLTRAAKQHGLFYAPDPSSQAACTIGGNVGENSGGPHCFRHGSTTRHILGLVIITPTGEIVDLSYPVIDPDGLDLIGLFVGSEGMMGFASEITIRLTPTPAVTETLLAIFPDLDAACDTVSDIIGARLEPTAIEILDKLTIEAVEASVFAAGYPQDAEAVLLLEIEGTEVEVATTTKGIEQFLSKRGCIESRRARDAKERAKLWAGRKGAFGAMGRVAPDLYVADVVVPRTKLREIVSKATTICHDRGLKISNVFHAGDGNLHPNISYDRRDPGEVERVLEAGDLIMSACVDVGGSLTGEHGVGLEKQAQMDLLFSQDDLDAMDAARRAIDPKRLMNPGKMIPLRACMEMRTRPIPSPAGEEPSGAGR
ncbi:MAG: glycolate oxidase subunit GlcD [Planctomycetota bacterium]|jgi:glycolate oxidase subunit GlcD